MMENLRNYFETPEGAFVLFGIFMGAVGFFTVAGLIMTMVIVERTVKNITAILYRKWDPSELLGKGTGEDQKNFS